MTEPLSAQVAPLVADLIAFVARAPRPYAEVIDAWRTSCPRLPVWEEAVERGLIAFTATHHIHATDAGRRYLQDVGRSRD